MTTPIEKAAHEAAEEIENFSVITDDWWFSSEKANEIIRRHLSPVQAELDAKDKRIIELMESGVAKDFELLHKDKLLREAAEFIKHGPLLSGCICSSKSLVGRCFNCRSKDWLSRAPGDQKPKDSHE